MPRRTVALGVVAAVLTSGLGACASDPAVRPSGAASSTGLYTMSPLPALPTPPATGRLYADMRQSSRDAALGRMEVWIRNDTLRPLTPTRITYRDGRFRTALPATRLREDPARSERGFPIYLPPRPACGSRARSGTVTLVYGGRRTTLPVEDETDVAGRYVTTRCQEIAVARVVRLSWSDRVPVSGTGEGSVGTLVLVLRPTGRGHGTLRVDTVTGTPLITAEGAAVWRPGVTVRSTDPPRRVRLPMLPARCDDHVFMESGGATAFRLHLRLDGRPVEIVLRMSPAGASHVIAFARDSCGKG